MGLLTWLIPAEAGIAIILWIGVIITAQAFGATQPRYHVAVVVGIFPGLAAWIMVLIKSIVSATGTPLDAGLEGLAHSAGAFIGGGFALEQGFLYSAMIWSAMVVCIVDREWTRAAVWSGVGALLALSGLMHSFRYTGSDTAIHLPLLDLISGHHVAGSPLLPAGELALAYALAALMFLSVRYWGVVKKSDD
jgi:AGZA family xanthine/uracil permease-like MFS transporter